MPSLAKTLIITYMLLANNGKDEYDIRISYHFFIASNRENYL